MLTSYSFMEIRGAKKGAARNKKRLTIAANLDDWLKTAESYLKDMMQFPHVFEKELEGSE